VADATPAISPADDLNARAEARVDAFLHFWYRLLYDLWSVARLFVFILYLALAVLSFWVWFVSMVFVMARLLLHAVMTLLLTLSGGLPGREAPGDMTGVGAEISHWWRTRGRYALFVYPLASHYVIAKRATRRFLHWNAPRKALAVLVTATLVIIPGLYVIPRPQYVQIVDNDVLDRNREKIRYLIHAVDLYNTGKTREYENEPVWWLGKLNEQGLKNQLQPGRFYRVWIVGVRWWYFPTLFPNVISATETDREGNELDTPSHFIPPTTTGSTGS
jgi:hypothetical protein